MIWATILAGPHNDLIRYQWKALFSPNTDFPLRAYPLVYSYSSFEWELKRRFTSLCGVPWPLLTSFLLVKVYLHNDISNFYEFEQDTA
eukprot:6258630-Prorocentrum_lima.AAC.1